jgi:hypothetical protein
VAALARAGGAVDLSAPDELRLELDVERLETLVLEQARQQAHAHPADLGERLVNGRQPRRDDLGLGGVVEADDRELLGHAHAALERGLHRADRELIVEGEDRRRRLGEIEQLRRGGSPAVDLEVRTRRPARSGRTPAAASAARCPRRRSSVAIQPSGR